MTARGRHVGHVGESGGCGVQERGHLHDAEDAEPKGLWVAGGRLTCYFVLLQYLMPPHGPARLSGETHDDVENHGGRGHAAGVPGLRAAASEPAGDDDEDCAHAKTCVTGREARERHWL